ncbi:hypothetical protein Y032_0137g2023 [Ancylostoma ceylanicum]|uniref:Uncharacterized protein n=1 Tax=Ancylostoma ceylanicum TaxID=53326 RepID=A0A016T481_9BILA|nr:hypothetical protein Y032_0137g2023 [Ancylostoma ceylanicum]
MSLSPRFIAFPRPLHTNCSSFYSAGGSSLHSAFSKLVISPRQSRSYTLNWPPTCSSVASFTAHYCAEKQPTSSHTRPAFLEVEVHSDQVARVFSRKGESP